MQKDINAILDVFKSIFILINEVIINNMPKDKEAYLPRLPKIRYAFVAHNNKNSPNKKTSILMFCFEDLINLKSNC